MMVPADIDAAECPTVKSCIHDQFDRAAFQSVLFADGAVADIDRTPQPDFFPDLNLDQVVEAMTAAYGHYNLAPFFQFPLHDVAAVRYRQQVLRDLEAESVIGPIREFAGQMRRMREHLEEVEKLHFELQKQAWFLDAVEIYCDAVPVLSERLADGEITSPGLDGLRSYLRNYTESERFGLLRSQTRALKQALAGVHYAVRISGGRVVVGNYEGEPDYSAEVQATFARFQQGVARGHLVEFREHASMSHVEEQILSRVALLNPEVFGPLAEYRRHNRDYLDPVVGTFDREVQFYLAYLDLIAPLRGAGLPFCYPEVSDTSKEIAAEDTFDVALAIKLVAADVPVVCNALHLEGPERMFVVSGPNNGGKTTFARMLGELHHLASLGLLVPGNSARLFLPDRIFTHFEREEEIETLRSKFEDELVRVHEMLERATSDSVIVMNESFNSTTLEDALFVGTAVMNQILELGAIGVYVTFVDEIASLSEATVSMVSTIVPEDPAQRTFKIVRRAADGLAYASAVAEKYGLTYGRLMERIG